MCSRMKLRSFSRLTLRSCEEELTRPILADKGKEQEGDDENIADEQRLTKVTLCSFNKTMTMAMELTDFINDIDLFMELSLCLKEGWMNFFVALQQNRA